MALQHSENGENDSLIFGVSSMQGWRISMEDAHAAVLDYTTDNSGKPTPPDKRLSFFGVYDGHGGDKVAIYTGEHLHQIVAQQAAFKDGNIKKALQDGFLATDRAILSGRLIPYIRSVNRLADSSIDPKYEEEVSGCTASVGVISKDKIWVVCSRLSHRRTLAKHSRPTRATPAAFSESRAAQSLSRSTTSLKTRVCILSPIHKTLLTPVAEKARIQAAGGFVDFGRVNGNLALSRAIGDFEFKKSAELPPESQIVTAFPDVEIHDITEDDEFLVVACDGRLLPSNL